MNAERLCQTKASDGESCGRGGNISEDNGPDNVLRGRIRLHAVSDVQNRDALVKKYGKKYHDLQAIQSMCPSDRHPRPAI